MPKTKRKPLPQLPARNLAGNLTPNYVPVGSHLSAGGKKVKRLRRGKRTRKSKAKKLRRKKNNKKKKTRRTKKH